MDMNTVLLLIMAFVMVVCLFATVAYFLFYIGIFYDVKVTVGKPVLENVWIAYKNYSGPYEKCGPNFTAVCSLCPKLDSIGIFYDDPNSIPAEELRYVVGVVLCNGDEKPSEELISLLSSRGYQTYQLPTIDHAVRSQFPFIMNVSAVLGAKKVYPALQAYVEHHKLSAHPCIEYYSKGKIHYIAPLSKQSDFFVPQVSYQFQAGKEDNLDESIQDEGSQSTNTSDEDESQGTTSSFEEIVADQVSSD